MKLYHILGPDPLGGPRYFQRWGVEDFSLGGGEHIPYVGSSTDALSVMLRFISYIISRSEMFLIKKRVIDGLGSGGISSSTDDE